MHFSIPDTQELTDESGTPFMVYNIHINGVHHCSARFSRLHTFNEELRQAFPSTTLPSFPPKKLFSLSATQLIERQEALEKYIQQLSQEPKILNSDLFNSFFLSLQQELNSESVDNVSLDVYLLNDQHVTVDILSSDKTDDVLEASASSMGLKDEFVYYFGLFLVKKTGEDWTIIRRLQDFESPFISLRAATKNGQHRIVFRKNYWHKDIDDDLLKDRTALNLLYVQAVSEIERKWIQPTPQQKQQLQTLNKRNSKKEFLRLCRSIPFYNYIHLCPCVCDYPAPGTRVTMAAGGREVVMRMEIDGALREAAFKIPRIRCWRIAQIPKSSQPTSGILPTHDKGDMLQLSMEYLMNAEGELRWINVLSSQAILLSMCIQSMVDELLRMKQKERIRRPQDRQKANGEKDETVVGKAKDKAKDSMKKISEKLSGLGRAADPDMSSVSENAAFGNIGDDDL